MKEMEENMCYHSSNFGGVGNDKMFFEIVVEYELR